MKLANVKAMIAKGVTGGLLAGTLMLAGPAKAQAQQLVVGVRVGHPYYGRAYQLRLEQERRREILRHDAWVRAHEHARYHRGYAYYR
jgi:hypothetical protein